MHHFKVPVICQSFEFLQKIPQPYSESTNEPALPFQVGRPVPTNANRISFFSDLLHCPMIKVNSLPTKLFDDYVLRHCTKHVFRLALNYSKIARFLGQKRNRTGVGIRLCGRRYGAIATPCNFWYWNSLRLTHNFSFAVYPRHYFRDISVFDFWFVWKIPTDRLRLYPSLPTEVFLIVGISNRGEIKRAKPWVRREIV